MIAAAASQPVARVLARLEACGCAPKRNGRGWRALCPAHEDRDPSLGVDEGDDGRALVVCRAGCATGDILAKLGLAMTDLFEAKPAGRADAWKGKRIIARYPYHDEAGAVLFEVCRTADKEFPLRRPDGTWGLGGVRRVLYRLPLVIEAVRLGLPVYVVEGEKDADAINAEGGDDALRHVATTNPGGAGKWRHPDYSEVLRGARVRIVSDRDEPGRRHALDVKAHLTGIAASVEVLEPVAGKDVSDHLAAGRSLAELVPMALPGEVKAERIEWKRADLIALVTADEPPIEWLVDRVLARGECGIITAAPKHGKTYLALALIMDAAIGRPGLGAYTVPRPLRVLWIDEEMGPGKLRRRIKRLIAGSGLAQADIKALADGIDLRPQQGFSFDTPAALDAFRRAVEAHRADLIVIDSMTALQGGEENSNSDRRGFYNRVIAPVKSEFDCGFLLLAHPPLPSKDRPPGSSRRPRGAGDALAFTDRASWLELVSRERNEWGEVLKLSLEETVSREGGGLEPQLVYLEDTGPEATVCRAEGPMESEAASKLGKANACGWVIIRYLEEHGEEAYQPDLKRHCEERGYGTDAYYAAVGSLETLKRVKTEPPRPGHSGKWLRLVEVPD